MATTEITRRADLHQTEIGAHLTPSNPIFQHATKTMAPFMGRNLGHTTALPASMAMMYRMLLQQAALLAYVDVFRWTALLAFICAAAVWLFGKQPVHGKAPVGMH
jgi:MFS transporter, DHA2 family, multidrug resistance protein